MANFKLPKKCKLRAHVCNGLHDLVPTSSSTPLSNHCKFTLYQAQASTLHMHELIKSSQQLYQTGAFLCVRHTDGETEARAVWLQHLTTVCCLLSLCLRQNLNSLPWRQEAGSEPGVLSKTIVCPTPATLCPFIQTRLLLDLAPRIHEAGHCPFAPLPGRLFSSSSHPLFLLIFSPSLNVTSPENLPWPPLSPWAVSILCSLYCSQ